VQQPIKVGSGNAPGKRDRGLLVAALESEQAVLDLAPPRWYSCSTRMAVA
jgi:hypothetical protein